MGFDTAERSQSYGFAMPKGHPYMDEINTALLHIQVVLLNQVLSTKFSKKYQAIFEMYIYINWCLYEHLCDHAAQNLRDVSHCIYRTND